LAEDTAGTVSVIELVTGGEVNVTLLTPAGTPGVLDNESFITADSGVANSQDSVVQTVTASALDDTRAVELEDVFISFDGDGDWLSDQSSLEGISVLSGDEVRSTVGLDGNSLLELASAVDSLVWVGELEFETVVSSVGEGFNWVTTVATIIVGVTVNNLLLREAEKLVVVDLVPSFQDTGGGESPARTALALILDLGDGTLASPVNAVWEISLDVVDWGDFVVLLDVAAGIDGLELSGGEVSELVQGELEVFVGSVVLDDLLVVLFEDSESGSFFSKGVSLAVVDLP